MALLNNKNSTVLTANNPQRDEQIGQYKRRLNLSRSFLLKTIVILLHTNDLEMGVPPEPGRFTHYWENPSGKRFNLGEFRISIEIIPDSVLGSMS
ncbi:hypothetical protein AVEN_220309-1 [Araneus ventricosus]|uniref:Uncharacterized protein n=1 Tax=Araneus ventricosus TaxID=182803 RepID=A0A4Y2T3B6_ARAVE|nr:hypothetical protein AVEN_220309-1 [Araneus ventricosus]